MDLIEWMGHWHLMAAISPIATKTELFRLGYLEQRHPSKRAGGGVSALTKSQEIRVLVVGSRHRSNLIRSLCSESSSESTEPESDISSPESSHAHVKLKRNRGSRKTKNDEMVAHLLFTDVPNSSLLGVFDEQEYDMVILVFDTMDITSLDYCLRLERQHLRKDTPRVYVAANLDKLPTGKKNVFQAASRHCFASELEGQPLVFSQPDDSVRFLDHLARSFLREPGITAVRSSPYEAQRRRRDKLVKGIGLGVLVVLGVGICSLALFKSWFFKAPSASARKK